MSQYEILANQLDEAPAPPLADVQKAVREWLRNEAGFAQVFTVNKAGYPVGRTMGAPVDDDEHMPPEGKKQIEDPPISYVIQPGGTIPA